MLNGKIENAINAQIKHELASAYLYLSMSAYFEANNLPGFASWMRVQAEEEQEHAMKFFDFINDRGGRVALQAIEQPQVEWDSPLKVFEQVYSHEQKVTSLIHAIYKLAVEEADYPTQVMLHWFIDEQVEEEKNASAILDQLKVVEGHTGSLFMIDHRLGKRSDEED